jgi:hypothetical protein
MPLFTTTVTERNYMSDSSRRLLGAGLGLLMGLLYGVISVLINAWFMPDVPLRAPDFGWTGAIVYTALSGALVGLIAAWPDDAIPGIILSAVAGATLTTVIAMRDATGSMEEAAGSITLLAITFFPRAFVFLPIAGIIRWTLTVWENELRTVTFSVRKLALPMIVLLALSVGAGYLSLYDPDTRASFGEMNGLVQAAVQATSYDTLPVNMHGVDGILQGAVGSYTLELWNEPDDLPVQRPMVSYYVPEWAIIARFENGFRFGCAFSTAYGPQCGEF